jgi:eukaryotic-like serine/threonine-protein kinase
VKTCPQCSVNYPDAVEYCPRDGQKLPGPPVEPVETQALYDPLIGSTIDGRYVIEALLGQGGMGYVYAARHAIIDKRVAIKVLRADQSQADESAAQRFLVEAKAASKIGHQNIVDITDFGVLPDGQAYFVMEFLDGPTLGKIMHEGGPLAALRAIGIVVQIARGLQAAHDKGIIHRDLKPENVFVLERDGQRDVCKIVDFGIAKDVAHKKKLTQVGMVLGTPEYMSPEQATGQPTDHRVDMYALGCILYEMLCGEVPFKGDTATKTLTMHVFTPVVPPSQRRTDLQIPPPIEAVCLRAMQKKAGERFADLREMMAALERVEGELRGGNENSGPRSTRAKPRTLPQAQPLPAPSPSSMEDLVPARKSRAALYVGAAAAVALALFGTALAVSRNRTSTPQPPVVAVPPSSPTPPVAVPKPPSLPVAPATVEIALRTRPAGAEVLEGNERLGVSPLQLKRPRGSEATTFTFRLNGYKEETREIVASGDKEIEVTLEPKRDRVATTKRHGQSRVTPLPSPTPENTPPSKPPKQRVSDLRNPFE